MTPRLLSRALEKEEKRKRKASQRSNGIQNIAEVTRLFTERRMWQQGDLPVVVQIGAVWGSKSAECFVMMFESSGSGIGAYWRQELCFRVSGEKEFVLVHVDFG